MNDRSQTVLIVEDNEDNRAIYTLFLEHVGMEVLHAADGEKGLEIARTARPDAILMDVSVPLVDGWTATEQLKGDPSTSDIPIIMLTAHALPSDRARASEVKADGYLAKPIEPRAVYEEIKRVLGTA
jgi:CheY-like chemotaxis protein